VQSSNYLKKKKLVEEEEESEYSRSNNKDLQVSSQCRSLYTNSCPFHQTNRGPETEQLKHPLRYSVPTVEKKTTTEKQKNRKTNNTRLLGVKKYCT